MGRVLGMDPALAGTMTLLTDDGLEPTYLASNLRGQTSQASQPGGREAPAQRPTAERLEDLKRLLDRGLVTQAEYDERRRAILDSV